MPPLITTAYVPALDRRVRFFHRDVYKTRHCHATARRPFGSVPPTVLPVDCTGNATVSAPMDGNDQWGDCMLVTGCHVDNIWTYRQGKARQSSFDVNAIVAQYRRASGGDNGLDEPTLLTQCWRPGLAGVPEATYVDSLDVDVTDVALTQYLIDQFYHVCLMWSVPDQFIRDFRTGSVWPNPGTPNPNNGHGTPLSDVGGPADVISGVTLNGFYRLWTWGGWAWVSPAFVASVQPASFVVFSGRQFDPATGYDSKGRHITEQAAKWVGVGGGQIPASILNAFPPPGNNPPTPVPPGPVPPTPQPQPVPVTAPNYSITLTGEFPSGLIGHTHKVTLTGTASPIFSGRVESPKLDPAKSGPTGWVAESSTPKAWPATFADVTLVNNAWCPPAAACDGNGDGCSIGCFGTADPARASAPMALPAWEQQLIATLLEYLPVLISAVPLPPVEKILVSAVLTFLKGLAGGGMKAAPLPLWRKLLLSAAVSLLQTLLASGKVPPAEAEVLQAAVTYLQGLLSGGQS